MTKFDQRGQKVEGDQYNIGSDLVINAIHTKSDIPIELQKIIAEIKKATQAGALPADISRKAETKINEVVVETEKEKPNPKTVLDRLHEAKAIIEGVASAAGLVTVLTQAAEVVGKFFMK
ncbi:MAG: hypothetical protein HONDAALG_03797 [Gammaproteobacteria bacterium]|nr:hypothetical protein [Gammaproteobacteria bacterium]